LILLRISQKNCDELRTHRGFPIQAIAANALAHVRHFVRYPHAYDT
jgi:hypothetical protein